MQACMANILLVTLGTAGDVLPFVRIGQALTVRGHRVSLLTHSRYAGLAQRAGLEFAPLDQPDAFTEFVQDLSLLTATSTVPVFFQKHILPRVAIEYRAVRDRCGSADTVIVARSALGIGARMAAEQLKLSPVSIYLAPSHASAQPLIEALSSTVLAADLNRLRAEVGLPPLRDWAGWLNSAACHLGLWPEWFAPHDPNWPPHLKTAGCCFYYEIETGDLPDEAVALLQADEAPILISGGSAPIAPEFFRFSVEACERLGRPGLIVTPHRQLVPEALPKSVKWFSHLPYASLAPRVAAIVHHG